MEKQFETRLYENKGSNFDGFYIVWDNDTNRQFNFTLPVYYKEKDKARNMAESLNALYSQYDLVKE